MQSFSSTSNRIWVEISWYSLLTVLLVKPVASDTSCIFFFLAAMIILKLLRTTILYHLDNNYNHNGVKKSPLVSFFATKRYLSIYRMHLMY